MFASNRRVRQTAARTLLIIMFFGLCFTVYEGASFVVKAKTSAPKGNDSSIKETEFVDQISDVYLLRYEAPTYLSSKSSDSITQQEFAVPTVTIVPEPEVKEPEQTVIKSFSTPKPAEQEVKYKYYEVYDPTDGNWYSMDTDLQEYTYDLCVEYGIEDRFTLLLSQFYAESRYDAKEVSSSNDYGIGQINKCNHAWLKKELGITNFLDAEQGILATVFMMSNYLKKYDTMSEALVYYNTGDHYHSNPYSRRVLKFYDSVREIKK